MRAEDGREPPGPVFSCPPPQVRPLKLAGW
jgi:hypothetical protein